MLPLSDIRVIDFGDAWSSPFACTMLADAGADVIRIEDIHRQLSTLRGTRNPKGPLEGYPDGEPGPHPWNSYYLMNNSERNKRGITLDLNHQLARDAFEQLVRDCDIFVTNYTPRAIEQLGLRFDDLIRLNPRLVYAHVTGYGCRGEMADVVALGSTIDAWTGHMGLRGYPETTPYDTAQSYVSDSIGAMTLAFALLAGLRERDLTGKPQCIEMALAEAVLQMLPQPMLETSITGDDPTLVGNRAYDWVPQGVYPVSGDDRWISIAAPSDADWKALCAVLGLELGQLELPERRNSETQIDELIAAATQDRDGVELMNALQQQEIPAMYLYLDSEIIANPEFTGGDFLQEVHHPDTGTRTYPGPVWRSTRSPMSTRTPHFGLGEHNRAVLVDQLRLSEEEYKRLEDEGAIGQRYSFW